MKTARRQSWDLTEAVSPDVVCDLADLTVVAVAHSPEQHTLRDPVVKVLRL